MEDSRPSKLTLEMKFCTESDFEVENTQVLHLDIKTSEKPTLSTVDGKLFSPKFVGHSSAPWSRRGVRIQVQMKPTSFPELSKSLGPWELEKQAMFRNLVFFAENNGYTLTTLTNPLAGPSYTVV